MSFDDDEPIVTPTRAICVGLVVIAIAVFAFTKVDDSCRGSEFCGDEFSWWGSYGLSVVLGLIGLGALVWGLVARAVSAGVSDLKPTQTSEAQPQDKLARLTELSRLRDAGALTDDEFASLKQELLAGE